MPSSLRKSRSPVVRSATTPGLRNRTYEPTAIPRGGWRRIHTPSPPRLAGKAAARRLAGVAERHRGALFSRSICSLDR
jgi:hypothetical protein